jgi:hypothetical protein
VHYIYLKSDYSSFPSFSEAISAPKLKRLLSTSSTMRRPGQQPVLFSKSCSLFWAHFSPAIGPSHSCSQSLIKICFSTDDLRLVVLCPQEKFWCGLPKLLAWRAVYA